MLRPAFTKQESINRLNQLKQQLAQQHIQEITSNMESDPCDTSREEEVAADKYDPYLESLSPPTKENQSNVFQK